MSSFNKPGAIEVDLAPYRVEREGMFASCRFGTSADAIWFVHALGRFGHPVVNLYIDKAIVLPYLVIWRTT